MTDKKEIQKKYEEGGKKELSSLFGCFETLALQK
jgi:hypothetical protein